MTAFPAKSSRLIPEVASVPKGFGSQAAPQRALSLTLRSTRTPPALPPALSQPHANSASVSASVQAVPVSFIR
jgi:hypothetical protein